MPNHASTALCHPEVVRALTLRECALIQEFPQDWEFAGSPQQQYEQVGNAVPCRLGKVAGEVIADHLDRLKARKWQQLEREVTNFRIVYLRSHVRTRQWYKDGEAKVWTDGGKNHSAAYAPPKTQRSERGLR